MVTIALSSPTTAPARSPPPRATPSLPRTAPSSPRPAIRSGSRVSSALARHAPVGRYPFHGLAQATPLRQGHQSGLDEVQAGEVAQDLRPRAGVELGRGPLGIELAGGLRDPLGVNIAG